MLLFIMCIMFIDQTNYGPADDSIIDFIINVMSCGIIHMTTPTMQIFYILYRFEINV